MNLHLKMFLDGLGTVDMFDFVLNSFVHLPSRGVPICVVVLLYFGLFYLITNHAEPQYYLSLLNQQLQIETQFVAKLACSEPG